VSRDRAGGRRGGESDGPADEENDGSPGSEVPSSTGERNGADESATDGEEGSQLDMDITEAELNEFLEADRTAVRADPVFKEALRRQLWDMVKKFVDDPDPTEH
jgi:hypothetical protein